MSFIAAGLDFQPNGYNRTESYIVVTAQMCYAPCANNRGFPMGHTGRPRNGGGQQGVIMTSYSTQFPYPTHGNKISLSSKGYEMDLENILLTAGTREHFHIQRVKMSMGSSSRSPHDRLDFCEDIGGFTRQQGPGKPERRAEFRVVSPTPMSSELKVFFGMHQAEIHKELKKVKSAWAPALDNYWELEWIPAILPGKDHLVDVPPSTATDSSECPNDIWITAKENSATADQVLHQSDLNIGRDIVSHLAIIFAQRRSYLFNPSLARRIHNIILPSGWLLEENARSSARIRGFIIVPLVTLVAARHTPFRHTPRFLSPGKARRGRRSRPYRDVLTLTLLHIPVTVALKNPSDKRRNTQYTQAARLRDLEHSEVGTFCGTWDWSPARARRLKVDTDGGEGSARSRTYRLHGDLNRYLQGLNVTAVSDQIDLPYTSRGWAQVLVSSILRQVGAQADVQEANQRKRHYEPILNASDGRKNRNPDSNDRARAEDRLHDHLIWALTGGKVSSVFIGPVGLDSALQSVTNTCSNDNEPDIIAFEFANYLLEARSDLPRRSEVDERWQLDPSSISFGRDVSSYYVAPRSTLVHVYGLSHQTSNTDISPTMAAASAWMKRLPLWMVGYISYYGVAISCARTLIAALNEDVDKFSADQSLLSHSSDRLLDAEEIFDFEFAVRSNRDFYHQLEQKDGVLSDFALLERKVDRVRADAILRREQMLSAAALWLSVTVFASTGLTVLLGSSRDNARSWIGGGLLFVSLTIAAWIAWRTRRSA
jgi:hypothetical protein